MQTIPDSALFAPSTTEHLTRDHIGATGGGRLVRAFIGEPADERGERVPCHYCDRKARTRIGPSRAQAIPLCSRHNADGSIVARARHETKRRSRSRLQGLV